MNSDVPFVRVVPDEIGRYGFAGATVVAHIRYRCATAGPDRHKVDDVRWWEVSLADLATELHVSKDVVQRTIKRLGDAVAAKRLGQPWEQKRAYHVPAVPSSQNAESHRLDLPERDSAPVDTDRRDIAPVPTRNCTGTDAISRYVPISEELQEEKKEGGAREEPLDASTALNPGNAPSPANSSDYPFDYGDAEAQPDPFVKAAPATAGPLLPDRRTAPVAVIAEGVIVEADPDPEPQRYCDRDMPQGTDKPCGACMNRRRVHEAWERRHPAPSGPTAKAASWVGLGGGSPNALRPSPELTPRRCPWCDDTGLVLMSDGTPGSDPSACMHDGGRRRPATPDDIAAYERRRRFA